VTEDTLLDLVRQMPEAERAALLNRACASKPELRERLEQLLRADQGPTEVPAADLAAMVSVAGPAGDLPCTASYHPSGPQPGFIIAGRYVLEQKLGEGGMGEVWVARQTEPVKRKVALKLIKAGMDSKAVLARFEAERQALALMDHPHIAKVLDGGLTPDRRPFFVMELVNGTPLTKFCDQARLGIRARLELFVPICLAVQHAHQKGIIHRDLKPANILVALADGKPLPKVIDFGVAKATGGKLTDESLATQFGAVVGTLEYMSPEQAGLSGTDIDTRADIYSLGVVLYELLTGLRPFDSKRLRSAPLAERARMIQEEEPSRPSARLATAEALPSLAAVRQAEPRRLMAALRGELDWVVMKCLEKQRERRYETANGLARDVQRYLADEVVEARPPSAGYRLRKYVRRNKGAVLAAGLVLLALLGGLGAVIAVQTRANRALADKNAALATEQAKVEARFELAQRAIGLFHTGVSEDMLLKNAELTELRTKLLKEAAGFYADLEKLLAWQTDAKSRQALAAAYFQLGELTDKIGDKQEALAVHRKALALRRELAAAEGAHVEARLDVVRSLQKVGLLLATTGDDAEALAALQELRELAERLETEYPTDAVRSVVAQSHQSIGSAYYHMEKLEEALTALRKALAIQQKLADASPAVTDFQRDLATTHQRIGVVLWRSHKPDEALKSSRQALAIQQKLADASPAVTELQLNLAKALNNIGVLLRETGSPEEALAPYRKALAIQEKLAEANPAVTDLQFDLAKTHTNIGVLLWEMGSPAKALQVHQKTLVIRQKLVDAHPGVNELQQFLAWNHNNIATLLRETGRPAEALQAQQKALAIWQKLVDAHPAGTGYQQDLAMTHGRISTLLSRTAKPEEALQACRKALGIFESLADAMPDITGFQNDLALCHCQLGWLLARQHRFAEALTAIDTGLAMSQKTGWAPGLGYSHAARGWALLRAGQPSKAAADLRQAVELSAKARVSGTEPRFELSRTLALLAGPGGQASSGVTKPEAMMFADQAVAALRDAMSAGWNCPDELQEPDFDPLRSREDFQKLLGELAKKVPAGPAK
jgi:tetratricopeptide (TPR) repeat protein